MQKFLRALRESGEVSVSAQETPAVLRPDLVPAIEEHERERRLGLRSGAPALDLDAAFWGVRKLYQACQLVVLRDAPPPVALRTLTAPFEGTREPRTDYSVDLGLSYLPSLYRLAERIAPGDPVLDGLKQLGREWPLSSIGIPNLEIPTEPEPQFLSMPFLRALYVDRILDADDPTRLDVKTVARSVRAALGAHPGMRPRVREHLERRTRNDE